MNTPKTNTLKVTQHVEPKASAKVARSTTPSNLIIHLMLDWTRYQHLGMTPAIRDRTIEGLRNGSVKPHVLCETLSIPRSIVTNEDLLGEARADLERAISSGANILGRA